MVVVYGLFDIYGLHDPVALGVHAYAVDLVEIEYGDVKSRRIVVLPAVQLVEDTLADSVVLVLDRGI